MKKYKNLVPIALVALMGIGVYSTISEAANTDAEYEKYLKKARKDVKLEVIEEAVDYYGKALELKDTPELCIEVGNVYADNGWDSEAVEWGEKLIDKYPDEPKVYEFLFLYCSVKYSFLIYKVIGIFNSRIQNVIIAEILYCKNKEEINPIPTDTEKQFANI